MSERTINYKALSDDEGVDRIEIVATPRYKTSGMSGDEWRVGAVVRFYRKDEQVHEDFRTSLAAAVRHLPYLLDGVLSESKKALWGVTEHECHQYGCADPAEIIVRLRQEFARNGDGPLPDLGYWENRRAFCRRHGVRGDSDREDCDDNYETVAGPAAAPQADDESPASVQIIDLRDGPR